MFLFVLKLVNIEYMYIYTIFLHLKKRFILIIKQYKYFSKKIVINTNIE